MAKTSAGLLMFRHKSELEVFLIHPGGPFFKNNDKVWSIPKGEQLDAEDLLETAKREFFEETGINVPQNANFLDLKTVKYNSKTIYCWAFDGDLPENFVLKSNPSKFGWPENDKGEFFDFNTAKTKILKSQLEFLNRLQEQLSPPANP